MQYDYYELKIKAIKYDSLLGYLDRIEAIYEKAVQDQPKSEVNKAILETIKIIKL